jgi:predicted dehydrogenase
VLLPKKIVTNNEYPRLSRPLRLGIVGGGRIAKTQAMAAVMSGRWNIVAGALSSDQKKSKERGRDFNINADRCYDNFRSMAELEASKSEGIDAVMVTTPNHLHRDVAAAFIAAGIDVICDKPLTNTVEDALDLEQQAEDSGLVFAVSYVMSCYPMVRQAREIVASGVLGQLNQIHVEFLQDWMVPEDIEENPHIKWRLDPARSGPTSCVGDIGTHAIHLAQFVSGLDLERIKADFYVCGAPKPLEDTAFMTLEFTNQVPGTLITSRLASGNRGGLRLRVFGELGGLEWDMENCERLKLNIFGKPDQVISRGNGHGVSASVERLVRTGRGFPEGLIEAWANLYTEFSVSVAARRDRRAIPPGLVAHPLISEGVRGVRFIEAAVASNEQGGAWVSLDH